MALMYLKKLLFLLY